MSSLSGEVALTFLASLLNGINPYRKEVAPLPANTVSD